MTYSFFSTVCGRGFCRHKAHILALKCVCVCVYKLTVNHFPSYHSNPCFFGTVCRLGFGLLYIWVFRWYTCMMQYNYIKHSIDFTLGCLSLRCLNHLETLSWHLHSCKPGSALSLQSPWQSLCCLIWRRFNLWIIDHLGCQCIALESWRDGIGVNMSRLPADRASLRETGTVIQSAVMAPNPL